MVTNKVCSTLNGMASIPDLVSGRGASLLLNINVSTTSHIVITYSCLTTHSEMVCSLMMLISAGLSRVEVHLSLKPRPFIGLSQDLHQRFHICCAQSLSRQLGSQNSL